MANHNQYTSPWTAAKDRTLRKLHAQGLSLREIARQMEVSPGSVHNRCKVLDPPLSFDTSQVQAASIARSDRARERRQDAADRIWALFGDAATQGEAARDGSFKTFIKGEYGAEQQVSLDFIPPNNFRELGAAITQFVNAATKIEAIDADAGLARAKSLVSDLATELGVLPMDPDDPQ